MLCPLLCVALWLLNADLERARTWGLVTGTDLHAMFLVTPTWELGRLHPNWQK
jgi:hypothetical protein